jgi:Flp pilus assembly pilin Flp
MEKDMKLKNLFARFRKDEDGAVTVDWVVLTAGVVAVAIVIAGFLGTQLTSITADITDALGENTIDKFTPAGAGEGGGEGD